MSHPNPWVYDVSDAEFEEKIVQKSHEVPVVIDFWAPWCGPCRSLGPILERMVAERKGEVLLAKVNTDENQELAASFSVHGIPHVVAIKKGRAVLQFTGLLPEAQLADFFNRIVPSAAEKSAKSAADLEKTDPSRAEEMYRAALKANPQEEEAIVGLARVLVGMKKEKEAGELLEQIGSAGETGAEAEKLRATIWLREQAASLAEEGELRKKSDANLKDASALYDLGSALAAKGDYQAALETLLKAAQLDRKLASSKVRETMVKIFHVVGIRSELADSYRDKLSALLY